MRKGFLFAPLVGTIIVLAVLLFITHVLSLERTGVALTTSDSYHNRLVSLLEMTRSDTASAFKLGMERSIVEYTITKGWLSTASFSGGDRWQVCDNLKKQMHDGVCSTTRQSGLPYWLNILGQTIYFEGMTFAPCDAEKYEEFIGIMMDITYCGTVFPQEEMFDCSSLDRTEGSCEGLPDCEDGTFWMQVGITNIYDKLPRLCSEDGSGNEIRSEAIGGENFAMHVRLRTFEYIKTASNITDILAYGTGTGCTGIPGIVEGLCIGKGCDNVTGSTFTDYRCGDESVTYENTEADRTTAVNKLKTILNNLANAACTNVRESQSRTITIKNCETELKDPNTGLPSRIITQLCGPDGNYTCAFVESLYLPLKLADNNTNYGVTASGEINYPFVVDVKYSG